MQFNKYTYTGIPQQRTTAVVAVVASRVACSHPGGREGSVCSPLPFLWSTNLRLGCVTLVGLYGLLVGLLGLGSVASTEPRAATVQQAWRSEREELEARLLVTELLVAERCGLAITHLDSLAPSIEDPGMHPAAFSCFALIYDHLVPFAETVVLWSVGRAELLHDRLSLAVVAVVIGNELAAAIGTQAMEVNFEKHDEVLRQF